MIIAGIDPGFSGAICRMEPGIGVQAFDMPVIKNKKNEIDEQALVGLLRGCDHVFCEKSQVMPGQGISSSGRYMMSFGIIRGICAGLSIPYTLVAPQTWKKTMMPDMPKDKGASIIVAARLFPELMMVRKKDHGKADSLLICEYGRRLLQGRN